MAKWALACVLWATVAHADPEGYQGGDGRRPGTTYKAGEQLSLTVRGVTVSAIEIDDTWICGGAAQSAGTYDLVSVSLELFNPSREAYSGYLAVLDLVIGKDKKAAVGGPCTQGDPGPLVELPAKKRRTEQKQFLIPRGERPMILVYNDDEFPALFALPKATRVRARRPRSH